MRLTLVASSDTSRNSQAFLSRPSWASLRTRSVASAQGRSWPWWACCGENIQMSMNACGPESIELDTRPKQIISTRRNNANVREWMCVRAIKVAGESHCGDWPISQLSLVGRPIISLWGAWPCGTAAAGVYMQIRIMRRRGSHCCVRLIALRRLCGAQQFLQLAREWRKKLCLLCTAFELVNFSRAFSDAFIPLIAVLFVLQANWSII